MTKFITLSESIATPRERVFDAFITPADLLQWHRGSDDCTTPHAETDPVMGGRFNIGYGDPAGEHSFDFTGVYTTMDRPARIDYTIDDGRLVEIEFAEIDATTTQETWRFEPERTFPEELQEQGWMAQLTHLKSYLGG